MAVKASATVTLSCYRDTQSVTRYYKLQSSTALAPLKPKENPPRGWTDAEPSYTSGSTNTLYFCDLTEFSDGTWAYSTVSKSSSYEAAKEAYNKAQNAQSTANSAQNDIDNLEIGGRNYLFTNRCLTVTDNGITFTPKEDGGIMISGTNKTPSGYGTCYSFPTGVVEANGYYSLFAGTYTLSLSGSEHYMNMITDASKFYYRLKRDKAYGSDIRYTFNGTSIVFTLNEDVEKVYIGFGFYSNAEIVDGTVYLKLEKGNKATDWTPAPEDVDANIIEVSDALDAFEDVIVGTQTAKTGSWTGVAKFKELRDGQRIAYWLPYAGDGNATLNLTLSDGSTTGAKNCYYGGTSRITTHYSAGNIIHLTYRENVSISGSSTKYTGWWADANYNADTYDRTRYSQVIKAGTTAIVAGNIIVAKDGLYTHLKLGNAFDVSYPILYAQSAISASSTGSNNYLTIPFDISTTQSITFTAYKPVYIKGKLSGTIFTPVSTAPLTQTVPTTNDGYQYILLGTAYSTSSMYLLSEHPIFQYFDGGFKTVEQIATEAAKTATNYMKFNNGLIIGDMTNSTLGNNVFIDSDSVDIRTGETILASYEGNKISLGKNSENSTIDFCDGSMLLTNKPSDMWGTRFEMLADRCVYINAPILVTIDSYYRNEDSNAHSYIDLGSAGYDATTDSFIPGGSVHISTSTDNGTKSSSISLNKDSITLFSSGEGGEPFITLDGSDNKISLSLNPYIITSSGGSYRCILSNYFNGYSGLTHSDGSVSNWMRTTVNGLIPFESGGNSSSLGKSGWPFKNGYFKTLYSDDIYLANGTSVYGKNTSGSNVSMMGISSDNNLFIGAATEPQFDYTNIYAGSWIQLSANRTGDITSHVLQFFREQSSDKRTILRGATNGAIYLGTGSFRYNTAFFTNAITASDLKEKEVIEDFDFKIEDFIMGLNPVAYRRTGDNDTGRRIHMGFGAQDVSSLLKDISIGNMSLVQACVVDEETVTKTDESGTEYTEVQKVERPYYGEEIDDSKLSWGLNYNEFIAPLVLFVQKQQREIEKLKARCEVLEKGRTL